MQREAVLAIAKANQDIIDDPNSTAEEVAEAMGLKLQ